MLIIKFSCHPEGAIMELSATKAKIHSLHPVSNKSMDAIFKCVANIAKISATVLGPQVEFVNAVIKPKKKKKGKK